MPRQSKISRLSSELLALPTTAKRKKAMLAKVQESAKHSGTDERAELARIEAQLVALVEATKAQAAQLEARNELLRQALHSPKRASVIKSLPWRERGEIIAKMREEHSAQVIADQLGVHEVSILNWSRAAMLIPEVQDALDEGEKTGLALRNLKHFFDHVGGKETPVVPKSVAEQRRLLRALRGIGRGRGGRKSAEEALAAAAEGERKKRR